MFGVFVFKISEVFTAGVQDKIHKYKNNHLNPFLQRKGVHTAFVSVFVLALRLLKG